MRLVRLGSLRANLDEDGWILGAARVMADPDFRLTGECRERERREQCANGEDQAGAERASTEQ